MGPSLQEQLAAAIAAERSAWEAVQHRLPGSPAYDARLWAQWRAAAQRCSDVRKAFAGGGDVQGISPGTASAAWPRH